jgi:acetyltransferase-like isoleucine patch superfamily enzyme
MSDSAAMSELAPIVLFVYKRPGHTERTLRALQANDLANKSVLYIYSDSPKHLAPPEDLRLVAEVRRIARSEQWCKEVHVIEAPHNKGLVMSFVDGITEVVNRHGRIIVLEEDQETSKGFLKFMNEALELYKDDEKVMHVSGYMYPAEFESKETTFFLQIQSCPGWGTWKRAWKHYNHDATDHYNYFRQTGERRRKFDIEGHAHFFGQLERNAGPILYSWAVRWHASCIRVEGLSLFPARSLVRNIGCDDTGEHCGNTRMYDVEIVDYLPIRKMPVVEDVRIRQSVDHYFRLHLNTGRWNARRLVSKSTRICRALLVQAIRVPMRWLVRVAYPELQCLDTGLAIQVGLLPRVVDSTVSSRARVHLPYTLYKTTVDDFTYVAPHAWSGGAKIGKFCSIGPRFCCGGGVHPVDGISTAPMFYSTDLQNGTTLSGTSKVTEHRPVRIGNDVYIGMDVKVLDGVTIGDGAVIGAGAVVVKDIPPYAIAVGCPARVVKYRFDHETIQKLLSIRWWDWPEEKLRDVEKHFFDVDGFVKAHAGSMVTPCMPADCAERSTNA